MPRQHLLTARSLPGEPSGRRRICGAPGPRLAWAPRRLERVFRTLPTLRGGSCTPPVDEGPDLPTRTSLAERLGALTGTRPAVAVEALAESVRQRFGPEAEVVSR